MWLSDFDYPLPADLIAQRPLAERSASRLLCLDGGSGQIADRMFTDLPQMLRPGDLMVFNDTRVIPARLWGRKPTGGQVEVLVERVVAPDRVLAHLRANKPLRVGSRIGIGDLAQLEVLGREGGLFDCAVHGMQADALLESEGHVPLPPYIERADSAADRERYQTLYARRPGAVAAPTAGLHFDGPVLERLAARGVDSAWVTLHVGAGTFQPVRVDNLDEHRMHAEWFEVGAETCAKVREARARGARVVAVGTTAVRSLEAASACGELAPYRGETRLFIRPGYRFRSVDGLVTNFHLPKSTLLMLVCAFAGYDQAMAAYRHAVVQRYRFFSYGDAMFLTPKGAQ